MGVCVCGPFIVKVNKFYIEQTFLSYYACHLSWAVSMQSVKSNWKGQVLYGCLFIR